MEINWKYDPFLRLLLPPQLLLLTKRKPLNGNLVYNHLHIRKGRKEEEKKRKMHLLLRFGKES